MRVVHLGDVSPRVENYVYRFDARGQRFFVNAVSLNDALLQVEMFDTITLQYPVKYRMLDLRHLRNLKQVGHRVAFKPEVWMNCKGDGPDWDWPWSCSPLPKAEMYRKYRSLCPTYY